MVFSLRFNKRLFVGAFVLTYLILLLWAFFNYCSRCVISMPSQYNIVVNAVNVEDSKRMSKMCVVDQSTLGLVDVNFDRTGPFLEDTENLFPEVKKGGTWKPAKCQSLQKVAIIIPYRDRKEHLKFLLRRLHPMLQKQQIEYRIFVIEQYGDDLFNKGTIMNICFTKAMELSNFDCVIFHDVDLIPEHDQNFYLCDQPHVRHLSPAVDEMRYHVMYYNLLGGVVAMSPSNFRRVNGYSNSYWGWGNEDDDMSVRTEEVGLLLSRPPNHIGRYKMVPHPKSHRASTGYSLLFCSRHRWRWDGLKDKEAMNHTVVSSVNHNLYTKFMVQIRPYNEHYLDPDKEKCESLWWFLKFYFP